MKKLLLVLGLLFSSMALTACEKVPAGHVGVKVFLLGGDKGVDSEELGVGRYWIGWNEELYLFPTFMQNYEWTADSRPGSETNESISFQTADGNVANADIGISYSIDPTKVTTIFQTYRRGVEEISDTFLRNMVADALVTEASNKPIEYVYGAGKAELIKAVQDRVTAQVGDIGINVSKIYWMGSIRLPDPILASIDAKNAASQLAQQRQNEVASARAEAEKAIATAKGEADSLLLVAKAQAESNLIIARSVTPELTDYLGVQKWNGQLPTTMVPQSALPMINLVK